MSCGGLISTSVSEVSLDDNKINFFWLLVLFRVVSSESLSGLIITELLARLVEGVLLEVSIEVKVEFSWLFILFRVGFSISWFPLIITELTGFVEGVL